VTIGSVTGREKSNQDRVYYIKTAVELINNDVSDVNKHTGGHAEPTSAVLHAC
jgi:hypothetical protein